MSESLNIFVELGCEELPAHFIKHVQDNLKEKLIEKLRAHNIGFTEDHIQIFSTPRRIAIFINELAAQQNSQESLIKGPPKKIAFDANGNPQLPLQKFLETQNITLQDIEIENTPKGEWIVYTKKIQGVATQELLPELLLSSLTEFYQGRTMRWDQSPTPFVRPVRWLVALINNTLWPLQMFGLTATQYTHGHRFLSTKPILITNSNPEEYKKNLKENGKVIIDYKDRIDSIFKQIKQLADQENAQLVKLESLLPELANLVEWPQCYVGTFDEKFLNLPEEVLVTTLETHQRYICLCSKTNEKLINRFIFVSNLDSENPRKVIEGNQRVIRPRLSDAEFFYQADQRIGIESFFNDLKTLVFHNKFGTVHDQFLITQNIGFAIADQWGMNNKDLFQAIKWSKADLTSQVVGEFPELQAIMASYYAQEANASDDVVKAIRDHLKPEGINDSLPRTLLGSSVAIADKLSSILICFSVGAIPTGDKDPYALRRAAIGILKICIEAEHSLEIQPLISNLKVKEQFSSYSNFDELLQSVFNYLQDRFVAYAINQKMRSDICEAVLFNGLNNIKKQWELITILQETSNKPEFSSIIAGNKRSANFLKKLSMDANLLPKYQSKLATESAENNLNDSLNSISPKITYAIENTDYLTALNHLLELKNPIDDFFDKVLVLHEDENIRNNRLSLINDLNNLFLSIADFSKIQNG